MISNKILGNIIALKKYIVQVRKTTSRQGIHGIYETLVGNTNFPLWIASVASIVFYNLFFTFNGSK